MDKKDHNSKSNNHSKKLSGRRNNIIKGNMKKLYQEARNFERTRERQRTSIGRQ